MKIGILDSGMGGLSVLHEAYHQLPNEEYFFYADEEHVPYGTKTKEQITEYVDAITNFLIEKGIDALVVACNTATSVAIETIRQKYDIPILGMEPAVKPAVEGTDGKRIMVIATPVTVRENKLKTLLSRVDGEHRVDIKATPGLVTFAEEQIFEGEEVTRYLTETFADIDKSGYQALVLGCTHFNYFKPVYKEVFGEDILLIDGNEGTVRHLADVLSLTRNCGVEKIEIQDIDDMKNRFHTTYFISGKEVTDKKLLTKFMKYHNRLEFVRDI
ncbi:MAG: glutamate racemase [Butyrivibrio sp.]|nr:glutamate racemase [Butyrivibrio sp.]